ncbi:MAG: glycyl radical protein [Lentihominibacter sp.]|nr:glycyl radical protein [Lentihominibacter sp.]
MMETIGKGFREPTERVKRLKKEIVEAMPVIETERARLVTEAFKESEGLSPIMRRAKVMEKLLNNMQVTIRDDELIVGTAAEHPRSSEIGIEFSIDWLEPEYDTLATRDNDPFIITDEAKAEMLELAKYWKGKTLSEYAMSLMTPECQACQDHAVFNVDNYKLAGVGHYVPFWEKVLEKGYSGIIDEVNEAIEKLDYTDPDAIAKKQFYDAIIITYTAAINFGHRYADKAKEMANAETNPQRKAELEQIAKNLQRVPEYGATTFWEAIQSYWLTNVIIHIESNGHSVSPGPFDRQMIDYYRNDPTITPDFAQELIDCLMIKYSDCNKVRDSISAAAFAGYTLFELMTIGGTDEEGNDLTNELSYMVLEAHAHTRMPSPSIGVRIGNQTPDEFLYRVCETIRLGTGMPNVFNDEIIIPALTNRGIPLKVARTYSPSGCVEPDIYHREFGWHDAASFNSAKIMEATMNNGKLFNDQVGPQTGEFVNFKNIEEIKDAYQKQMAYFVSKMVEADNCVMKAHADQAPLPFEAALIDGCIQNGKSAEEGGAYWNFTGPQTYGFVDSGDSLYCIEKNVFQDKKFTLAELKEAVDNNFGYTGGPEGGSQEISIGWEYGPGAGNCGGGMSDCQLEAKIYEKVKAMLAGSGTVDMDALRREVAANSSCAAPSAGQANPGKYEVIRKTLENTEGYGNDIDEIDQFSVFTAKAYTSEVEKYTDYRGGKFQAGIYPVSANVLYGKDVGALPDGRLARTPLADGVSPRAGKDTHGPTAAANSVSKLDHASASNGTLYNMKFSPAALAGDEGLKKFAALIRGYFARKGMHMQFNVVDKQTLIDAQAHPEQYKDLVVRVAGYSAFYTTLAKETQDNIIARTEMSF